MEFENKMNLKGKNLVGNELIESGYHDGIVMVRAIEQNKEKIIRDPNIELEKFYYGSEYVPKLIKYIYKKYCATQINYEKLYFIVSDALKLCFKDADYLTVINTLKQRENLSEYQNEALRIIEINHKDLKTFNYDESLINDILFRLKEFFGIKCQKW